MHAISQESRFCVISETFKLYVITNMNCIIANPIIYRLVRMNYMLLVKFFTTTQGPARPALRGATFKHKHVKVIKIHLKLFLYCVQLQE